MMDVLELVTPPPVQISSSPASFMRSSYSPSGNGSTRSSFCRSTQRCASPGLSSVSLPIWYIVTTTTLMGNGAAREGADCEGTAGNDAACAGWGAACDAAACTGSGAADDDNGTNTPTALSARFKA